MALMAMRITDARAPPLSHLWLPYKVQCTVQMPYRYDTVKTKPQTVMQESQFLGHDEQHGISMGGVAHSCQCDCRCDSLYLARLEPLRNANNIPEEPTCTLAAALACSGQHQCCGQQ